MTERLDALTVRESNGKSYWTRIGVAFPAKQGAGWSIMLDAMPASSEGQYKILLREPQPRDGGNERAQPTRNVGGGRGFNELDDDVAF